MDDAARLRDALGVRLPESLPEIIFIESVTRFATSLLRYLRAHAYWSRLNNWLIGLVSVLPLSKSSFSNCVNRVW
ncbi:hypothetical protein ACLB1M_13770 [Escherichia coli]